MGYYLSLTNNLAKFFNELSRSGFQIRPHRMERLEKLWAFPVHVERGNPGETIVGGDAGHAARFQRVQLATVGQSREFYAEVAAITLFAAAAGA